MCLANNVSYPTCSLSPLTTAVLGGRAQAPSLVQGLRPRNAPSKTMPQRPDAFSPAVRLQYPGGSQPYTQPNSLKGGKDEGLVKTDNVSGRVTNALNRGQPFESQPGQIYHHGIRWLQLGSQIRECRGNRRAGRLNK